MGSVPRRCRACRAHRLPGQATVGIADRPGRARAFVRKQLRLAGAGARLFLFEGPRRFLSRCAVAAGGAAGDGAGRARDPDRRARARRCSARSASATPASGSPSTSSAPCGRSRSADDRRAAITSDDDDRITRVGKLLRTLRLDELPQIVNILKWRDELDRPAPRSRGAVACGTPAKSRSTATATW